MDCIAFTLIVAIVCELCLIVTLACGILCRRLVPYCVLLPGTDLRVGIAAAALLH